jgi:hypothetical protein
MSKVILFSRKFSSVISLYTLVIHAGIRRAWEHQAERNPAKKIE